MELAALRPIITSDLPWVEVPTITLDGRLPWRARLQATPPPLRKQVERLLSKMWVEVPARIKPLAWLIDLRTRFRFHREAVELARLIGGDWREILLANLCYELVLSRLACSTLALATPDGPVLARNMDFIPEGYLARASAIMRYTQGNELRFAVAGWPGAIGAVTGLSRNGFALALNAVPSPTGIDRRGYPVLLLLREVLSDARDFADAVRRLTRTRLMMSALFSVVGTKNSERVVIERSPTKSAVREAAGDEPLIATNDYRALFPTQAGTGLEALRTTCERYDTLSRFWSSGDAAAPVTDEHLLYALTDPDVIQSITAQHAIMRPAEGSIKMWVPRRLVEKRSS